MWRPNKGKDLVSIISKSPLSANQHTYYSADGQLQGLVLAHQ